MVTRDEVRAAVDAELRACEERVRGLLEAATTLSEREVVAIGARVADLNREARANLGTLTGLHDEFRPENVRGHSSLEAAVQAQTRLLGAFVASLNEALDHQRSATTGIVEVASKIRKFVAGIEVVAIDLRMLTLNARLEAARWGSQGAAFATVAAGMRSLTTEVQRVNEQVGELATTLSGLAKRIVENENAMQDLGQRLATDGAERMGDLKRAYEDARRSTAHAVFAGTEGANRMVALSTGMLTNLQFQDRMVQTLREVDAVVCRARAITADLLDVEGGSEAEVRSALERVRDRAGNGAVRISAESELESSDRTMTSGVVELF
jgi:methyl-accepting chemotaxis protein